MTLKFNPNMIQNYTEKLSENLPMGKMCSFNVNAILSIFDKDNNGIISQKEFNAISQDDYNNFVDELCQYNLKNSGKEQRNLIPSYKDLINFLKDSYIRVSELENFENEQEFGNKENLSGTMPKSFKENKHLKEAAQMSDNEIINELASYGLVSQNTRRKVLIRELEAVRNQIALSDEGSDVVDGHIGTYIQPEGNKSCTILAHLDSLTDEEIQKMYKKRTDKNGKVFYDVTLIQDNGKKITVTVSAEDIKNGEIDIVENGVTKTISNFTSGDADVRMFEMAYVKAFGSEITQLGEWGYKTQNRLNNTNSSFSYKQDLENISDFSNIPRNSIIATLNEDERKQKQLSDEKTIQTNEGKTITVKVTPFGLNIIQGNQTVEIALNHALQVRGYDKSDNTIIISGNRYNNVADLKIPAEPEVLAYFELDTNFNKTFGI